MSQPTCCERAEQLPDVNRARRPGLALGADIVLAAQRRGTPSTGRCSAVGAESGRVDKAIAQGLCGVQRAGQALAFTVTVGASVCGRVWSPEGK